MNDAPGAAARVMVVQYAGDFREAVQRLAGGVETYYAQAYSIDAVRQLAADGAAEVATLTVCTDEAHDALVFPGVRSIGAGFRAGSVDEARVLAMVAAYAPTHLVLRTPLQALLRWAARPGTATRTLLTLADSFQGRGLRHWWRQRRTAALFNAPSIEWVANHGWSASVDLLRIGVHAAKVVPWDWPHPRSPEDSPIKLSPPGGAPFTLLFVGSITLTKGVADCIDAVAELRRRGLDVRLSLAGKGDIAAFRAQAERLGVADAVQFLGLIANSDVVPAMQAADAVIVPSHHAYPEGFPMTIFEALVSRTPIVATDHPMFRHFLRDGETAAVFPEKNALALADAVERLATTPAYHRKLSVAAVSTWRELHLPIAWGELIRIWLQQPPDAFASWLAARGIGGELTARLQAMAGQKPAGPRTGPRRC